MHIEDLKVKIAKTVGSLHGKSKQLNWIYSQNSKDDVKIQSTLEEMKNLRNTLISDMRKFYLMADDSEYLLFCSKHIYIL